MRFANNAISCGSDVSFFFVVVGVVVVVVAVALWLAFRLHTILCVRCAQPITLHLQHFTAASTHYGRWSGGHTFLSSLHFFCTTVSVGICKMKMMMRITCSLLELLVIYRAGLRYFG